MTAVQSRPLTALCAISLISLLYVAAGFDDAAHAAQRTQTANANTKASKRSRSRHSILLMVNDKPITKYNIDQRAAFLSLQTNVGKEVRARFTRMISSKKSKQVFKNMQREVIQGNPGKSRDQLIKIFRARQKRYALGLQKQALRSARGRALSGLRRKAMNELIEEQLKLQAAKKMNIVISNATIDKVVASIAKRNKKTPEQFAANIKRLGANISTMRSRMKANFAWRDAIRRRFGALIAINDAQIDDTIASAGASDGQSNIELQLQRIVLPLTSNSNQSLTARRYGEAERIAARFKSCKSMSRLIKGISGASFKKLGTRNPSSFTEPTRTMLLTAGDNQMTPPTLTAGGIELYAVCGRRAGRGSDKQRAETRGDLRQKEFNAMASRHLRDLRTEARICRRQSASYAMTVPPCS